MPVINPVAISLPQPWASAIVLGQMRVLNMPFLVRHQGPIYIHAHADRGGHLKHPKLRQQLPDLPPAEKLPIDAWVGFAVLDGCFTGAGLDRLDRHAVGPVVWRILAPVAFPYAAPERVRQACPVPFQFEPIRQGSAFRPGRGDRAFFAVPSDVLDIADALQQEVM